MFHQTGEALRSPETAQKPSTGTWRESEEDKSENMSGDHTDRLRGERKGHISQSSAEVEVHYSTDAVLSRRAGCLAVQHCWWLHRPKEIALAYSAKPFPEDLLSQFISSVFSFSQFHLSSMQHILFLHVLSHFA